MLWRALKVLDALHAAVVLALRPHELDAHPDAVPERRRPHETHEALVAKLGRHARADDQPGRHTRQARARARRRRVGDRSGC